MRFPARSTSRGLWLVLLSALLSGCGILQSLGILSEPEDPTPLSAKTYTAQLTLAASNDTNPDTRSRPSPIQVRVFLTQPQSDLLDRQFEELFDYAGVSIEPRPSAIVTLTPGQTHTVELSGNMTQTLLIVAAAYRDPYQTIWRASMQLDPDESVERFATITASEVVIAPPNEQ